MLENNHFPSHFLVQKILIQNCFWLEHLFLLSTDYNFVAHFTTTKCSVLQGKYFFTPKINNYLHNTILFRLFELMVNVHGKQLGSFRDGQLSYPHCSRASLPEAGHQKLAHIISPLTDKCSS